MRHEFGHRLLGYSECRCGEPLQACGAASITVACVLIGAGFRPLAQDSGGGYHCAWRCARQANSLSRLLAFKRTSHAFGGDEAYSRQPYAIASRLWFQSLGWR